MNHAYTVQMRQGLGDVKQYVAHWLGHLRDGAHGILQIPAPLFENKRVTVWKVSRCHVQ